MTIQETIDWCLSKTASLRSITPEITNVRYEFTDFPIDEIKEYAIANKCRIHNSADRAYLILCTISGKYDTDIWLYSVPVKIKPAEIIAE